MVVLMKKYFIHSVVASLLLSSSVLLAMEPEVKPAYTPKKCTEAFAVGVKEINSHLYIGQKEPGLYFVMERIDTAVPDSRLPFWKEYIAAEWKNHDLYKKEWTMEHVPQGKGFLVFKSRDHILRDGLTSFDKSVKYYNSNNELWIAYTSTKIITKADDTTFDDIEMAMPVMTDPDAPMVTYMGISRAFHYLLEAIKSKNENNFKVHPGLAISLQSMAAKVMRIRDERKLYQINAPVPAMRNIALQKLPDHVYIGDNLQIAKHMHQKMTDSGTVFKSKDIGDIQKRLLEEIDLWLTEESTLEEFLSAYTGDYHSRSDLRKLWPKIKEMKAEDIDILVKTKKAECAALGKQRKATTKQELHELAKNLKMTPQTSPIKQLGKKVQIFDKDRKNIIFEHDKVSNIIIVNNKTLEGDATNRYNWFYHYDMCLNDYVTIDLDALSEHLKLLEDK